MTIYSRQLNRGAERMNPKELSLGVARSCDRGVLPAVFQIQENDQKRKEEVVGTLKKAFIKDNANNANKLAHFLFAMKNLNILLKIVLVR